MASVMLMCSECGKRLFIQPARSGIRAFIPLARAKDWRFDTETNWRCPEHGGEDEA